MSLPDKIKQDILWYFENYLGIKSTVDNENEEIDEILLGSPTNENTPVQSGKTSNTTFDKVVRLSRIELSGLAKWVDVVEDTYNYYLEHDRPKADLINISYMSKNPKLKSKEDFANALFISVRAYYNWVDEITGVASIKAANNKLIEL